MKIDLKGKTALITASSKGIGFGVAKVLAECNARVILLSRNEKNLEEAKRRIESHGGEASYVVADLSNMEQLEKALKEMKNKESIDILFFSTGGPKPGFFKELEMDDWKKAVDLLLYPAIYITKELLPDMMRREWGRIIYSTSVAIKEPIPNIALSNVIRITMAGLVRTLAKEVGRHGITVNGIMPGIIKTDRMVQLAEDRAKREGKSVEESLKEYVKDIPVKRLGMPEEIGYLAAFLASDYGAYINGAMLPIDGGRLNSVF